MKMKWVQPLKNIYLNNLQTHDKLIWMRFIQSYAMSQPLPVAIDQINTIYIIKSIIISTSFFYSHI